MKVLAVAASGCDSQYKTLGGTKGRFDYASCGSGQGEQGDLRRRGKSDFKTVRHGKAALLAESLEMMQKNSDYSSRKEFEPVPCNHLRGPSTSLRMTSF